MKRTLEGQHNIAGFMNLSPLPGLLAMQYPTGGLSPRLLAGTPPGRINLEFRDRYYLVSFARFHAPSSWTWTWT